MALMNSTTRPADADRECPDCLGLGCEACHATGEGACFDCNAFLAPHVHHPDDDGHRRCWPHASAWMHRSNSPSIHNAETLPAPALEAAS